MPYVLPPNDVSFQVPSVNADFTSAASAVRSAVTPLVMRTGSAWYSAWIRSGALPARCAVTTLVTSSSPWAWRLTVTFWVGFFWFQMSTTFSMLVVQVQKVRLAGAFGSPFAGDLVLSLSLEQAASRAGAVTAVARPFSKVRRPRAGSTVRDI